MDTRTRKKLGIALSKAIGALPESPCARGCTRYNDCANGLLACSAYVAYWKTGKFDPRDEHDHPNRTKFDMTMVEWVPDGCSDEIKTTSET